MGNLVLLTASPAVVLLYYYVIRFYALKSQLHEKRGKARKSVLIRAQSSLSSLKDNIQPKTDFHSKRNYMKRKNKLV